MIIGIDIDDTLVNSSQSFDRVMQKYNINFQKKFKDKWTIKEKRFMFKNYLDEVLKSAKIMEDAKEVIDYLNILGYKLIVITARSNMYCKGIEEFTKEFFEKENINISKFYFRQHKKSGLAKKLNLDLMIDDNYKVYKNMKKEKIDCILFGDKIKNWKEVLQYIKRKEKDEQVNKSRRDN